ncbi:Type 1 glutamine amidotransferase-like domain-containing protein [Lyngbya sp. CCY1209]|uniref:cyanophycinase n=1 Tax=Lyngbya sp. CCY1209 TaxID=2886103 RepID=UPI002D20E1BD|nr:Type 1 glutamine amidotransferase-like domain-containing protein [Lyngbya sp. CCY1209]MEB3882745.1 Type 1 glutamine amidotransferase-like domain-containing protein [Lyngbya sp. CCY1209]
MDNLWLWQSHPIAILIGVMVLWAIAILAFPRPAAAGVKRYLDGNAADVKIPKTEIVHILGGGGPDVDPAFQWAIDRVRGGKYCDRTVDVVIIRDSGEDGYNEPIFDMAGVDSVETLLVTRPEDANHPDVVESVRNAEMIFFAGGDQCRYLRNYLDTDLYDAIKSALDRGAAIGGTSAGAMIQSRFVFTACGQSIDSESALDDPYRDIELDDRVFDWRYLENTIVDTHFADRDRMGRLMTFVARARQDGLAAKVLGIGIDEGTSLTIDETGLAEVMGQGSVYFVSGSHSPEVCEPGTPLTFSDFQLWKRRDGETFDLKNRPDEGDYSISVNDGRLSDDPY